MLADRCGKGGKGTRGRSRLTATVAAILSACVVGKGVKVEPLAREPVCVTSPVKAHLKDGSTVVFRKGVSVEARVVRGEGVRHDVALRDSQPVRAIPLDDVAAMERFADEIDGAASVILSLLATAGVATLGQAAAIAIFGSCPTVYSDPGRSPKLEAETFSYSIVPLFEAPDLDRLSTDVGADGSLRLEIRNEALETHYINHLQLLEVRHGDSEAVMPAVRRGARRRTAHASGRGGEPERRGRHERPREGRRAGVPHERGHARRRPFRRPRGLDRPRLSGARGDRSGGARAPCAQQPPEHRPLL